MNHFNKINILKKYFLQHEKNKDIKNMTDIINSIKLIHGQLISEIYYLQKSNTKNYIMLSESERINKLIISHINECEEVLTKITEKQNDDNQEHFLDNDLDNDLDNKQKLNKNLPKLNKNLPSIILFYAEWCGHCTRLIPIWDAFEKIVNKNKCNILKISCVQKEEMCNKISFIKGYPTIAFIPLNSTEPILFKDERTPDNLISFINECVGEIVAKI